LLYEVATYYLPFPGVGVPPAPERPDPTGGVPPAPERDEPAVTGDPYSRPGSLTATVETAFMIAEEGVLPAEVIPAVITDDRATSDAASSVPLVSDADSDALD